MGGNECPELKELTKVWKDQENFNRNFFPPAEDFGERSRQTKELVLHLMSELDELLRTTVWKPHRRQHKLPNPEQVRNELTDILKYWISLAVVWGVKPKEALADYWRKSMVCRQRYAEEYVLSLSSPSVVCDIDGVLADYYTGFLQWVSHWRPDLKARCLELLQLPERPWLDASYFGMDAQRWQELKHQFRVGRGKVSLPLMPGAKVFLDRVRSAGYRIILLTSRPIDTYPNLYADTMEWLLACELPFDFIWWAIDKGEKLLEQDIPRMVYCYVDDDYRYIEKIARMNVQCYWLTRPTAVAGVVPSNVQRITSLEDITLEEVHGTV